MSQPIQPTADLPVGSQESSAETTAAKPGFDIQEIVRSQAFIAGLIFAAGLCLMYWPLVSFLPEMWGSEDGYYSHGALVPLISGYIVYRNWHKLKDIPVRPQYWAIPLLLLNLVAAYVANATLFYILASVSFIASIVLSTFIIAGWRWAVALFLPTAYLAFAMPMFNGMIDAYTNPLQLLSTKVSYSMLQIMGSNPFQADSNTIMLDHFTLNVAAPCSGLKLLLALAAFTTFFMLIANLKWWGNLILILQWIPLALLINGLRIALIGIVGNQFGHEAGMAFHDYSGYITLIPCFFIIFSVARGLGWKN